MKFKFLDKVQGTHPFWGDFVGEVMDFSRVDDGVYACSIEYTVYGMFGPAPDRAQWGQHSIREELLTLKPSETKES